jgi:hypothetical protein
VKFGQEDGRSMQQAQAGMTSECARHSDTEAVRTLARQQGWFFISYLVCDDRGTLAYCIEDLAEFAEDQGWINYDPSSCGFSINWSEVPRPAAVAADKARASLVDGDKSVWAFLG